LRNEKKKKKKRVRRRGDAHWFREIIHVESETATGRGGIDFSGGLKLPSFLRGVKSSAAQNEGKRDCSTGVGK